MISGKKEQAKEPKRLLMMMKLIEGLVQALNLKLYLFWHIEVFILHQTNGYEIRSWPIPKERETLDKHLLID